MATPFVPVPASRAHSGKQPRVPLVTSIAAQHCGLGIPDFPNAKSLKAVSLRCFAVRQEHQGESV
jgi:hypothetical protein